MGARLVALALVIVLSLTFVLVPRPARGASAWCAYATIVYTPTQGKAGQTITMSYTFNNNWPDVLDVYEFDVQYSWSSGQSNLGSMVIPGYGSWTFTQSVTLPTATGSDWIYISVFGKASSDSVSDTCIFNPAPFTVQPGPVVSASASPISGDAPLNVTFSATTSGGTPPYSYYWTFGDGADGLGASVVHEYTRAANYPVQVTSTDGSNSQATSQITVTVYAALLANVTVNHTSAAPGMPLAFSASALGGSGQYTYAWTFGDGGVASTAQAVHTYYRHGTYNATVIIGDSSGGYATEITKITVADLIATATESSRSAPVGGAISFSATVAGGAGGPYAITWTFGDGANATGSDVQHAYAQAGIYTATVFVRDASGAMNQTALAPINVGGAFPVSASGWILYGGIGAAVVAAGVGAAVVVLRRRARKRTKPQERPRPPASP